MKYLLFLLLVSLPYQTLLGVKVKGETVVRGVHAISKTTDGNSEFTEKGTFQSIESIMSWVMPGKLNASGDGRAVALKGDQEQRSTELNANFSGGYRGRRWNSKLNLEADQVTYQGSGYLSLNDQYSVSSILGTPDPNRKSTREKLTGNIFFSRDFDRYSTVNASTYKQEEKIISTGDSKTDLDIDGYDSNLYLGASPKVGFFVHHSTDNVKSYQTLPEIEGGDQLSVLNSHNENLGIRLNPDKRSSINAGYRFSESASRDQGTTRTEGPTIQYSQNWTPILSSKITYQALQIKLSDSSHQERIAGSASIDYKSSSSMTLSASMGKEYETGTELFDALAEGETKKVSLIEIENYNLSWTKTGGLIGSYISYSSSKTKPLSSQDAAEYKNDQVNVSLNRTLGFRKTLEFTALYRVIDDEARDKKTTFTSGRLILKGVTKGDVILRSKGTWSLSTSYETEENDSDDIMKTRIGFAVSAGVVF